MVPVGISYFPLGPPLRGKIALRAVRLFKRAFVCGPLGDCLLYWDSVPRVLNPPTPFSRERSGPTGFPSPQWQPCPPTPARHLRTCLNPPNPMFFIGTLSKTLTLRAAFSSSTYLLSQIPGPGRSSDDDFLNHSTPPSLFKGAHQASVRTRARGHRFAVLRPASEDALLIANPLDGAFSLAAARALSRRSFGLASLFWGCPKHCRDVAVNFFEQPACRYFVDVADCQLIAVVYESQVTHFFM